MEHLGYSDLQRLLDFVRDCYAIHRLSSVEEFITRLVTTLPRLIPAAHVTYNEMYPHKSESHNCVNTPELASSKAACLWEEHMNEHPVVAHNLTADDHRAVRISDFWSARRLHDTGLHNDFYRYYGIEDALCITVPSPAPLLIGIGWHDDRIFTDRERLIAELARPHIAQALLNAKLLSKLQCQLQLLQLGLEDEARGAIACDSECRVQYISSLARRFLIEYFAASENLDARLPDALRRWVQLQNAQLATNDVPSVRLPLVLTKEKKRLTVRLLSSADASLILLEEKRTAPEIPALEQYGLSRREAEVLAWVARGKTNSEIATILGITVRTTKKHVEHILQKLGVETRTAAAAVVLKSACNDFDVQIKKVK